MQSLDPITGRALEVAQQLGVIHLLERGARTVEEVARETECAPRGMESLLFLLASAGYLGLKDGLFQLAPDLLGYLKNTWPSQWSAFPNIVEYERMAEAVRSGRPVRSAVEGSADGGEFFAAVTPELFDLHLADAEALSQHISRDVRHALDLGAGSAVWSLPWAKARPQLKVTAVDRARVLEQVTTKFLHQHGVTEQYELRDGDYHEVHLENGLYDLVLLGHLLHADGWEGSRTLLRRCRRALAPEGTLVVAEFIAPEARELDYATNVFHLNMLMLTECGVVFTATELEALLKEAGFRDLEWLQGPGEYPMLLATNL